tara:strand:- start:33 stop:290 length:258 start_codon:yes stop_codon:yes gene_type:complete
MELDLKWLLGIIGVAAGILATKLFDRRLAADDSEREEITKLTLAMTELKVEIKHLAAALTPMPKIQQDLNELHSKVREINARERQ